jgi:hypothetical protein
VSLRKEREETKKTKERVEEEVNKTIEKADYQHREHVTGR